MNLRKGIPDYFIDRSNTTIQIVFTSIFAFVFINIYKPFGSGQWYDVSEEKFLFFSALLVIWGMLVVIISRTLVNRLLSKVHKITVGNYLLLVLAEISLMAGLYTSLEVWVLKDARFWGEIFYIAIQNTSLILLIPYIISLLFFAYKDKKRNIEQLMRGNTDPFISFYDEAGVLRLTIKAENLLYLESSENYVEIRYLKERKIAVYLLRSSLKRLEDTLAEYNLVRCHRSFIVNLKKVHHLSKAGGGSYKMYLDSPEEISIPVSKTYAQNLLEKVSGKVQ